MFFCYNSLQVSAYLSSLATHPSGRLLTSCSSGDGLVKFWNCGRTFERRPINRPSPNASLSESPSASMALDKNAKGDGDNEESEVPGCDDDLSESLVYEGSDSDDINSLNLPSRAFATYSVRSTSDENLSDAAYCRVLLL